MKRDDALKLLLNYSDGIVQAAAAEIQKEDTANLEVLRRVPGALGQILLDVKYMAFDLEATRKERDVLKDKLGE